MKAATIRDVAQRARVSVASVSRVLTGAGAVTEPTRQRVMEAVAALSYVPHSGARSLSTSRTDTVGVILPDLFGEFFSELIRGMDLSARAHGLHLIVSSSHDDADEAASAMRSMRGRVDGLIVLSPHVEADSLTGTLADRLPVLLMNSGGAQGAGRPSIVVDNIGGAMTAVRHLVALGRRDIVHIGGPDGNLDARDRREGYQRAIAEAGLVARILEGDFTQACGHIAMSALLKERSRPDAVFAANDMSAVGALLALQEAGVRCPDDVAIMGFDDVPIAALVRPALCTLRIEIAEMGRRAMERLVGLIAAANDPAAPADTACEIIRPRLVIRQSSGGVPVPSAHPGAQP